MRKSPRICCFRQKKRVLKTFTERRSHSACDSDRSLAGCKAGVGSIWRDKVCAYVHHTCAHWVLPSVTEIKVHWMSCIPRFCPTSSNNLWQEKRIYHRSSEWQRNQTKNKELVAFRLFKCVDGCQNWCNPKWLIECHPSSLDFLLLTHQFCSLNNLLFHILLVGHWFFYHISFWSRCQPVWKYMMPLMWLWNFYPTGGTQQTWAWARWNSLIYTTRGSLCLLMTWTFEMLTTQGICAAWSIRT